MPNSGGGDQTLEDMMFNDGSGSDSDRSAASLPGSDSDTDDDNVEPSTDMVVHADVGPALFHDPMGPIAMDTINKRATDQHGHIIGALVLLSIPIRIRAVCRNVEFSDEYNYMRAVQAAFM